MTAAAIGWELHRDPHRPATATAYLGDDLLLTLRGPLLRARIALATRRLTRRHATTRPR